MGGPDTGARRQGPASGSTPARMLAPTAGSGQFSTTVEGVRMKGLLFAVVAALLVTGEAFAQKNDPGGPPKLWDVPDGSIGDPQAAGIPDSNLVRLGKLAVQLDDSPLENIAAAMGQRMAHAGDASASVDWICLHIDGEQSDARLWLSSSEVAGPNVDAVTVLRYPASAKPDAACPAIKPAYSAIKLPGDLRLGEAEAALRQRLGKPSYDKAGIVGFMRALDLGVPESKGGPCQLSQSVWAKIEDGVVLALSYSSNGVC